MAINNNFISQVTAQVNSLTDAEKLNFSQEISELTYSVSNIANTHQVQPDVRNGNLIPIVKNEANFESFPFRALGTCAPSECEIDLTYSTKKWELALIDCRVPVCMETVEEDYLLYLGMQRLIPSETDLSSAFILYLQDKFVQNLLAAHWRVLYFGDKSETSNLFNGIDGFFTQAQAAGASQIVNIAENNGATFAAQFLSGERVYEVLQEMYEKAVYQPWFSAETAIIKMTRVNAQAFVNYLNKLGNKQPNDCSCDNPTSITGANFFTLNGLRFNGIPIEVHGEWDQVIEKTTLLNPTGTGARVDPNRIILTYRSNLRIGTSREDQLANFDIFYDKKDKKIYMDGGAYVGASLVLPKEQILAI